MENRDELKAKLLGSLLLFTRTFYQIRTGREFDVIQPIGRESHIITICRELTKCLRLETNRLIINIPPGLFKSTLCKYFIPWAFAHYADCQFIYVSYSHDLAAEHTSDIKGIMELREYRELFGIEISKESSAKDSFKTTAGGAVKAFGSGGAITGQNAGLPITDRFSGCVILDDMHKPDEVHSDSMRESVIRNYRETITRRPRSPKVPIICIGQRLHEADLWAYLLEGKDGHQWKSVILKGRDDAGNSIHPILYPIEALDREKEFNEYVYSAQIQQDPLPAGGGLFKTVYFTETPIEPKILATFITADTAESSKTYNDATVFSFWGIYRISHFGEQTNMLALQWLDCLQAWIEPKDLVPEFLQFYTECMRYEIKPTLVGVEKKSTGTTLLSFLSDLQGINVIDIERGKNSGSKSDRFIKIQSYLARKQVTFPRYGKHNQMCIEHMSKITANNTHRRDDIADTCYDAVDMGLIRQVVFTPHEIQKSQTSILNRIKSHNLHLSNLRGNSHVSYR